MAENPRPVQVPGVGAPAPELGVVEVPAPVAAPQLQLRDVAPAVEAPAMPRQADEVAVREIPAPLSTVELPAVPARTVTAPDLRAEPAPSVAVRDIPAPTERSEEHTSELQSPMRISYAVFCMKKKKNPVHTT